LPSALPFSSPSSVHQSISKTGARKNETFSRCGLPAPDDAALSNQPLLLQPLLDEGGDLQVVPVHHQHVRVSADAGVRQVEDLDKSTFAGTPPGVNTTSFTGLPVISTSRPPTWNDPISRRA
jgi:hypothetical protein